MHKFMMAIECVNLIGRKQVTHNRYKQSNCQNDGRCSHFKMR